MKSVIRRNREWKGIPYDVGVNSMDDVAVTADRIEIFLDQAVREGKSEFTIDAQIVGMADFEMFLEIKDTIGKSCLLFRNLAKIYENHGYLCVPLKPEMLNEAFRYKDGFRVSWDIGEDL